LASYGETSIFQEDYYDGKESYNRDCGFGGFIRVGVPNEVYSPRLDKSNSEVGLFDYKQHVLTQYHEAAAVHRFHAVSSTEPQSAFARYTEVLYSVAGAGAIGFVTALVAVFAALKVVTVSNPSVDSAIEMESSVTAAKPATKSIQASWGKNGNSIPDIEF